MKLSTKTRYGMRFMIDLGQHCDEQPVALKDIAERQDISKKYLEQVVAPLVDAGLLVVTRGAQGGYSLGRSLDEITLGQIVRASEGPSSLLDCLGDPTACPKQESCLSRKIWSGMNKAVYDHLDSITLEEAVS